MIEFKLPDVGEGLHEAEIVRWLVQPGQAVKADQPMVEVQTDKAIVEIGSPAAGTIAEIRVEAGKTVTVGTVLVAIEAAGAATAPAPAGAALTAPNPTVAAANPAATAPTPHVAAPNPAVAATKPAATAPSPTVAAPNPAVAPANPAMASAGAPRILAAPSTRKLARELGVDLAQVAGSGPAGRITLADLQAHAAGARPVAAPAQTDAAPQASPAATGAPIARGGEEVVPLHGLRRRTAERMSESWRTIPHVTLFEEVDAAELVRLRKGLGDETAAGGAKLTYLPFVIKALVVALKEHPYLNASFDEAAGAIRLKRYYHIGVATAAPDGLLVPVVHDADQQNLAQLAAELQRLAEGARSRRLQPGELSGSTFTISNYGAYGGYQGTPIINPPEVAILGIGRIAERPAVRDGQVVVRPTLPLCLSFDHRVVDGEGAGRFMARLMRLLAEPERLLLALY